MERNNRTTKLIIVAFFIAMEIIFTRYLSINTPILRIGFGFLPIALLGIIYGPLWSSLAYAIGDILGMLIFPTGPYFPGFTLTAFLTGLTFGIILYRKDVTWTRCFLASSIVVLGFNLCLDTLWLHILMGQGYLALLPARIIKCAVSIPVQTVLIPLIWNRLFRKIPYIKKCRSI